MKNQRSNLLVSVVVTLLTAFPATADDDALTKEQILAHPEVAGAIAAIDAYVEGVQRYEKVPGISVGIVHDQDRIGEGC